MNWPERSTMNNIKSKSEPGITAAMAGVRRFMLPHAVALLCALPLVGCLAQDGDAEDGAVDVVQLPALTNNALTNNALTNNALTNNALTNNALTNNALTNNALMNNALSDPNARDVLKYIVSCALPAGRKVSFVADGVSYTYPGELGLAPQWEKIDGKCNTACQQWVSACVMARVDYLGVKVLISVRGDTPALKAPLVEQASYTVREGTYFGNIFAPTTERYACISPGRTGLPRVCGPTLDGCAVEAVGECDETCKNPRSDGSFPKCSNENSVAAQTQPSFVKKTYDGTVTVFLAP